MERIFIPLYHFFAKRRWLMYFLLIATSALFIHQGLKVKYEENIVKLLPQTQNATESELAFGNLRVKDKIFLLFKQREKKETHSTSVNNIPNDQTDDSTIREENATNLITYADKFVSTLLDSDTTTHLIAHILNRIDDDFMLGALDYALMNVPSFVDTECYAAFDSLLTEEAINRQMKLNSQLIENDEEGNISTMVGQDPIALRNVILNQVIGKRTIEEGNTKFKKENQSFGGYTLIEGQLFTPDSTIALAFLSPNFSAFNSLAGTELINMLETQIEAFEETHPDVEILFHGAPVQSVFNSRQIRSDLVLTIGLSLLIICFAIGACFRNRSTLILLITPIVYGTFFALSGVYWIQGGMSLMAIGIGAIVLGVALSYCLHVLTHYKYVSDPERVIRDQATPVCLGCITTIGAFIGLLFTQSELLRDFGLFASLAMMGTTLFTLIFLPHFFTPQSNKKSEKAFLFLDRINSYPLDQVRSLRWGLIAICLITIITSGWVTFDSNLRNIGYNEPKVVRSGEIYADKMNHGNASMYYAATGTTLDEALHNSRTLSLLLDSLKNESLLVSHSGPTLLFVPTNLQKERIAAWRNYWSNEQIYRTRQFISSAAERYNIAPSFFEPFYIMVENEYEPQSLYEAGVLPESLVSNFIEESDGRFLVFSSVLMSEADKPLVNDAVANLTSAVVIDPFYYTSDMVRLLNDDFNTVLGISSIFVFIVLLIAFRNFIHALIAFVPMSLSWYIVRGVMGIFSMQFNLINIVIATFIFGIGVDYSIFVMNGLLAKQRGEGTDLLTWHKTAISLSAFVLIVVVCSLLFATHPAIQSIGTSTLIGMSANILITYTLQPVLFRMVCRLKRKK